MLFRSKIPVRERFEYRYGYKRRDIRRCGLIIGKSLNPQLAPQSVIVPIPPSKPANHPDYDDRMAQMASFAQPFEHRELLTTSAPRDPAHLQNKKRSIDAVYASLQSHPERWNGATTCILIDDVLTTGASFKACKRKLADLKIFQRIIGVFAARCAR